MNDDQSPMMHALTSAMEAAQESLAVFKKVKDEENSLRAARTIADIAQKISKLTPGGDTDRSPVARSRREFEETLAEVLLADEETRKRIAESLRHGWGPGTPDV